MSSFPLTTNQARARVAGYSRNHAADSPVLVDARRDLKAAKLAAYIARVVDDVPPLTPEQRDVIVSLLRPPGISGPPPVSGETRAPTASGGIKSPTASGGSTSAETVLSQSLPIAGGASN